MLLICHFNHLIIDLINELINEKLALGITEWHNHFVENLHFYNEKIPA